MVKLVFGKTNLQVEKDQFSLKLDLVINGFQGREFSNWWSVSEGNLLLPFDPPINYELMILMPIRPNQLTYCLSFKQTNKHLIFHVVQCFRILIWRLCWCNVVLRR
ncbi:hypothetical protein HanPI659440_Chr05g0195161 [Helianthus annuus]|nr:hypothetical protein HanPI659440_Chr05g0195161 [Helianthus annuus]